jgi:carotenoid cleavage dioxygenase-like enzyme
MFRRGAQSYRHWFDGDGLVQAWQVGSEGVRHRARFVPTPKFISEEAAGRFVVPAIGTFIEGASSIRNGDDLNTANTAVFEHAGSLYALWEGGSAFGLDPETLAPKGFHTWGEDMEHLPFSAHPMRDADGSAWNFGLFRDRMLVWHIDATGHAATPHIVQLPFPGYLHAFSMNSRYLVFVVMPYVMQGDLSERAYFDALEWQPERGCRALVLDKQDLSREKWFGLPAGAAYHYGPMRQHGDSLVLQACWSSDGEAMRSPLADAVAGTPSVRRSPAGQLQSIELNLRTGQATFPQPLELDIDFPIWNETGDRGRLYAPLNSRQKSHPYFDQLATIDVERGVVDRFEFGDDMLVEEHRFLASKDSRGTGWLIGTVLDVRHQRTGLYLFDAGNLAAGPRARAWLDQSMPLGFHGWFSPGRSPMV